jgi:hypothetical protein
MSLFRRARILSPAIANNKQKTSLFQQQTTNCSGQQELLNKSYDSKSFGLIDSAAQWIHSGPEDTYRSTR